jgi:hypothetical protein
MLIWLLLLQTLHWVAAEWVEIYPSALYFNYVSARWTDSETVFAVGNGGGGDGALIKSSDHGLTWSQLAVNITFGGVYGLAVNTFSNLEYFLAVDDLGYIYSSIATAGDTWTTNAVVTSSLLGVTIGSNGMAYACGTSSRVYYASKSDNFTVWTKFTTLTITNNPILYDIRYACFLLLASCFLY